MADPSDEKKALEGGLEPTAYDLLEKDFQEVCLASAARLALTAIAPCVHLFSSSSKYVTVVAQAAALVQVLQELQRDKSLERFRTEYEKLFKAVRKSHGMLTKGLEGALLHITWHIQLNQEERAKRGRVSAHAIQATLTQQCCACRQ